MKKIYPVFVVLFLLLSQQSDGQFTALWKKTSISPQDYTWFNNTSNDVSTMDYNPVTDRLLVGRRGSKIYIVNPNTGVEEGEVNTTGITG